MSGGAARRPEWMTRSRTYPLLKVTSAGIADFVDRRRRGAAMFGNDATPVDNESDSNP